MAVLNSILNLVTCGAGAVLGTGLKGCRPFFKKVTALWLLPSGTRLDPTRELDDVYISELQAEGKLIVLRGIRGFSDDTPDDSTETLDDGTLQLTSQGLYQFTLRFINGLYFNAALHSLSGYGNYDAILVDRDGSILGTRTNDGSIKGFTLGIVQALKLQWATDTTAQREGLMIQLLDRSEVDSDYVYVQGSLLGDFNPNRVNGVNQVQLDYTSVPTAGATTITVKAVTRQDGKPFTGAVAADFLVTRGSGSSAPPSAAVESPAGVYTLTIAAAVLNETIGTRLYDNTNNRPVVLMDLDPYQSNEAVVVVI